MTKAQPKHRYAGLVLLLTILAALSGCMHQQFVSESYPRWGEEHRIARSESSEPLILRVLAPQESVQPAACILLVHGMNEYIGRYRDVALHFSRKFLVAGFDYYAHGLSNPVLQQADKALVAGAGKQDVSQAYLSQTDLYDLDPMRRDFGRALEKTIQRCDAEGGSEKPVFIISHSLGALVTATYLMQLQSDTEWAERIQGVVFLGPGFAVSELPGWRGWLANPLIKLSFHAETHFLNPGDEALPMLLFNQILSLVTVPVLDGLFEMLSWPVLRNIATPSTPAWVVDYLTDSEAEKQRLRTDGWIIRRTLLRYVKGVEKEIVEFHRRMASFSVPYYLIYSGHDPVTAFWGGAAFIDATIRNHPDNAHLLLADLPYHQHLFLKEPRRSEILQHIGQWLDRRIDAQRQRETEDFNQK